MGILAVDSIKSRTVAPVTVSDDLNVTGVSTVGVLTATSVVVGSGVTVNADGVITSGIVTATTFQGNVNGTTGTFSGDVSIGGTLTYEDVERVDATGLSTFREGLNVGSPTGVGGTFNPQGDISAGIGTFSGAISGTTGTFTATASDVATFTSNQTASTIYVKDTDGDGIFISGSSAYGHRIYTNTTESLKLGTNSTERLEVDSTGRVSINEVGTYNDTDEYLLIKNTGAACNLSIVGGTSNHSSLNMGDTDDFNIQKIKSDHTNNSLQFFTSNYERLRITTTGGLTLSNGELIEKCYINSTAWSTTGTVDLDNGMVQYNSSNLAGTTNTLDIISSAGINTSMATGDMMAVTCMTAVNASTAYVNNITIDGIAATETWVGGSAPTDGGTSGVDIYAFNIVKTADATFLVVANQTKTS